MNTNTYKKVYDAVVVTYTNEAGNDTLIFGELGTIHSWCRASAIDRLALHGAEHRVRADVATFVLEGLRRRVSALELETLAAAEVWHDDPDTLDNRIALHSMLTLLRHTRRAVAAFLADKDEAKP